MSGVSCFRVAGKGDADGKAPRRAGASPATSSHEFAGDIVSIHIGEIDDAVATPEKQDAEEPLVGALQ